jgi:transcription antitermination protein NusB
VSAARPRRTDTRDPRRARERALKILFQADIRGEDPAALMARVVDDPRAWAMLDDLDPEDVAVEDIPAIDGFTRSLVDGVAAHLADLDALIERYARRWTVGRMPVIDRNVLRLGAYEMQHESTSPAVVINEVIELAKDLSTEDSGRYVNGVLEAIRKHVVSAAQTSPEEA